MSTKKAEDVYPLSPLQEGLLFHSIDAPAVGMYVLQLGCRLAGRLDVRAFELAWQQVIERHPPLRTAFAWKSGGRPLQVVGRKVRLPFVQEDWRDLSTEERERRWEEYLQADRERGFDLSRAPLMRLALMREADEGHRLLWTHHHLILDGWSVARVLSEFFALYEARCQGLELTLPAALPFRNYLAWLSRQDLAAAQAFWRSDLAGFTEPTPLIAGAERISDVASGRGDRQMRRLSETLAAALAALARAHKITQSTLAQGAFALLLGHYSGKDDIVFGVTVSGRPPELAGVETMVGMFVNTLPFRVDVNPAQSLSAWLRRLQERLIEMRQYEHSPLIEIQGWSEVPRGLPLFQTLLAFENYPVDNAMQHRQDQNLKVLDMKWATTISYPLIFESGNGLGLDVFYDSLRFEPVTITRLLGHLEALLTGFATRPEGRLIDISLLTEAESCQLLVEWRGAALSLAGEACLHELIEAQAARTPEATAVEFEDERLTYRELDAQADRLAFVLRRLGSGPEVPVGVCLERSLDLAVALFAVLKSGAACLPLDPSYPRERLGWMLEDSRAPVVVTARSLMAALPTHSGRTVYLDDGWEYEGKLARQPSSLDQAAYVLYTSGSTGRPKGVVNTHRSLLNHCLFLQEVFPLTEDDSFLQKTPFSFDASVWEIFQPLLTGARLVMARPEGEKDPSYLVRILIEREITALQLLPPSVLKAFLESEEFSACPALRFLFTGGEVLTAELRDRCLAELDVELCNLYGPTEFSLITTWVCDHADRRRPVPIGRPTLSAAVYVLDRHLRPLPIGVAGELHVAGPGIARGYLERPEFSAERFIPDPFSGSPGGRLYKTGDLANFGPDGVVEFLGRMDHQVKIRGFRVELGEIESVLRQQPSIREAVVLAKTTPAGEQQLVAYLVPASAEAPPQLAEVSRAARERLPEHMLPAAFVVLAALPKTPNNKLDRRALAAIEPRSEQAGFERTTTQLQELLADIWAEVLAVPRVGARDDFFDLGGHSLLVMQVASRVQAVFGVPLRPRTLFEKRTLAGVAEAIEAAIRSGESHPALPMTPVSRDLPLPLSFAQQRLWFIDQLESGSPLYNLPAAVRLRGPLDIRAFGAALSSIVDRHEVLRTAFPEVGGQPVQAISARWRLPLPRIDLGRLDAGREGEILRLAAQDAARPFDLTHGPVLRATLLSVAPGEHVALFNLHHIAGDAWSVGIFLRELGVLYRTFAEGSSSPLPALPIQYADFACWQRGWLIGDVLEEQLRYWREKLRAAPAVLDLPTDRPRPAAPTRRGAYLPISLGSDAEALRRLGRRSGVTPFMIQLAAFQSLLGRYTEQQDLIVGTPIAGRNRLETEGLIGFFVNTLALRTDLSGDPAFGELLGRVRETTLGAYSHQDLPFERLVEELQVERSLSYSPLFQVMFATQNAPAPTLSLAGVALEPVPTGSGTVKFDLHLLLGEDLRRGALDYSTDLFDRPTAVRLVAHLEALLAGAVAMPEARLSELPLLSEAERFQLLAEWNATEGEHAGEPCLHELVEAQVARTPAAVAVVFEGRRLSYRELDSRANRLAHRLRELGVGPESVVGVYLERSLELMSTLFAVLKAGGAYLPLDPSYPEARLEQMVEDSRALVVVTEEKLAPRLSASVARRLCLDAEPVRERGRPAGPPSSGVGPDNAAYVIYTSGSTGRPKGVVNIHRAIRNRLLWMQGTYKLSAEDRVLQKTPFSFDVSVWELFWPLMTGAPLVVARPQGHQDSGYLVDLIARERVTTAHFVPSMLQVFLDEERLAECRDLTRVIASGEALPFDLQQRFFARLGAELHNLYGPTEAAVDVTSWYCRPDGRPGTVPIGRPIANTEIHLLDRDCNLVPIGIAGELHIGGVGLARGYLLRPELTAERFIPDSFSGRPGGRLYRTGDLVRRLSAGELQYLGRIDHQVKLRGFRVELGEIEAALLSHPTVREAVVLAREGHSGDLQLVSYVVLEPGEVLVASDLRSSLAAHLPSYMVPGAFVELPVLPLTTHGKVDRRALARSADLAPLPEGEYVAPRTPEEELLAEIFGELLRLDRVGVEDNFFALGGHSLLATRLSSRVRQFFRIELPLRSVFEQPTVGGLARVLVDLGRAGQGRVVPAIVRVPRDRPLPLSFAQLRLWLLQELHAGSSAYNMPIALLAKGPLKVGVLARSLTEIVRRHEVLRTTFDNPDGEPVQRIHPACSFPLPLVDLTSLAADRRASNMLRLAAEEAACPFDLSRDRLLRACVIRLALGEHALLFTMHHIVSDAWSMGVMVRELTLLYTAFLAGRPSPLHELPVQYVDFAVWQREWLRGEVLEAQLSYWRRQLGGDLAVLELPTDHPRPALQTYRGAQHIFALPQNLLPALLNLGRHAGATLFMTLLAAFQTLLHRYTEQSDITLGTLVAGRRHHSLENLVGFFVNALVIRADLAGEPTFERVLGLARETALDAFAHQDLPFERLVDELKAERDVSRSPLFQVLFMVQSVDGDEGSRLPGLELSALPEKDIAARFDVTLSFAHTQSDLHGSLIFNRDLFEATTVRRMVEHLGVLLTGITAAPERRITDLPLLDADEVQQLLVEWNPAAVGPREQTIHDRFEEQVESRPEAVALVFEGRHLTYGELGMRSNRLAHYLGGLGVGPEVLVGLCAERSLELIVALLGILKAGGAYVPLDPSYPAERLAFLLEDTLMPVLVGLERLVEDLPITGMTQLVLLDADGDRIARCDSFSPRSGALSDTLAYVMYTSGSTGEPKGVAAVHRGVVRLVRETDYARFDCDEVFLQLAPISFDASTLEIWGPLLNGGRLAIAAPRTLTLAEIGETVARQGVTALWLTAGLFHEMVDSHLSGLAPVRQLLAGGDVLSPPHVRRLLEELPGCQLINGYGPTENTTFTACHALSDPLQVGRSVPIGRPIASTQVFLLDAYGKAVPPGITGELYTGGEGLARGYFNRPELTAERWVPDNVSGRPGRQLYRTGDRARWSRRGELEFLGRLDHQVKVRGFRVELGEIEVALRADARVLEAVVLAREEAWGGRRLVAYVVAEPGREPVVQELREELRQRLPEYMVPSAVVLLESLPLTRNGKVDRQALPAPEGGGSATELGYVAPRSPIEEVLASIWGEVLGVERVSLADNFFDLGGHSLLATRVISQLRGAFQVELGLHELFEAPTVAGLARRVEEEMRSGAAVLAPPIVPIPRDGELPLSFAQQRLWFLDQLQPGSAAYNIPFAFQVSGQLRAGVLAAVLTEIVRRHEALRTVFATKEGSPVQVIRPASPVRLPMVDLSGLDSSRRQVAARLLAAEEAGRPFDLANGPLLRAGLLRLEEEEHVALLSMHHIVSDGWSMGILTREVVALYEGLTAGRPSPLPELPVQYVDFAHWQRRWLQGEVRESELSYWRDQLAGAPSLLELPADRRRPAVASGKGAGRQARVPPGTTAALAGLSRQEGATLFITLLAAFYALLSRYTGREDLIVGTDVANRNRAETEGLIGFFVNQLVLRADLGGEPSFRALLGRVRQMVLAAYLHQDLPFELLVQEVSPERDLSKQPLFQVTFSLQNLPLALPDLPGLALRPLPVDNGTAKVDLSVVGREVPGGLLLGIEYSVDLFDETTIERLLGHFENLLVNLVEHPAARLSDLEVLSPTERRHLLEELGGSVTSLPSALLAHQVFARQAAETPAAVAAVCGTEVLTYAGLSLQAERIARRLLRLGIGREDRVGVFGRRGLGMLATLLGILRSGAAFVPLDPDHPDLRLQRVLATADLCLIATEEGLAERTRVLVGSLSKKQPGILCWDGGDLGSPRPVEGARHTPEPALPWIEPQQLAYLFYTSGSTGEPKGVMIHHAGMLNHLLAEIDRLFLDRRSVVAQIASHCFDVSVWQFLAALLTGGRVEIYPRETVMDPLALLAAVRRAGVTVLETVPTLLEPMLHLVEDAEDRGERIDLPDLRYLITSAETLPVPLSRRWFEHFPTIPLVNTYGLTECSDNNASHIMPSPLPLSAARVPVGRPLAGVRFHLVDARHQLVPTGCPGQITVGGVAVGRGYLGDAAKTAAVFVPDPFARDPGARLYLTGDLGRWTAEGALDFLGRRDHQVKVRGQRIELGEIEAALQGHPAVRSAVVLVRQDTENPEDRRLVAYVLAGPEDDASPGSLGAYLREVLPAPMVPSVFVRLESLPLTPNGKVDRQALPVPEPELRQAAGRYVAPQGAIEERLARIWGQVLGLDRVGVHDNFFALGGDSILAIQIVAKAHREGLGLTPKDLFQRQTIAELAGVVNADKLAFSEPGPVTGPVPLTPIQRWFFEQGFPQPHHYNQAVFFQLREPLEPALLDRALGQLLVHHDALRLRFHREGSTWVQVHTAPEGIVPFTRLDLSALPADRRSAGIERAAAAVQAGFDLTAGPLLRCVLFDLGASAAGRLLVTAHHLVVDGVSWRILLEDLETTYRQVARGEVVALPPKSTSFKRWAERLLEHTEEGGFDGEIRYWLEPEGALETALPIDFAGGVNSVSSSGSISCRLSREETSALLLEVPKAYATQVEDVLLAALAMAFRRWTGSESLLVSLEGHGREGLFADLDLSRTIGWFTSEAPLWIDLEGVEDPGNVVKRVKERLRSVPNGGIGYGALRYLGKRRDLQERLRRLPPAPVLFNYLGQLDRAVGSSSPFQLAAESSGPIQSPRARRSHLLEFNGGILGGRLDLVCTFSENLHRESTVERFTGMFVEELRRLITHCQAPDSIGYTPSDFPLMQLEQGALDELLEELSNAVEEAE